MTDNAERDALVAALNKAFAELADLTPEAGAELTLRRAIGYLVEQHAHYFGKVETFEMLHALTRRVGELAVDEMNAPRH